MSAKENAEAEKEFWKMIEDGVLHMDEITGLVSMKDNFEESLFFRDAVIKGICSMSVYNLRQRLSHANVDGHSKLEVFPEILEAVDADTILTFDKMVLVRRLRSLQFDEYEIYLHFADVLLDQL